MNSREKNPPAIQHTAKATGWLGSIVSALTGIVCVSMVLQVQSDNRVWVHTLAMWCGLASMFGLAGCLVQRAARNLSEAKSAAKIKGGLCIGCGYDVRGGLEGCCPECGRLLQDQSPVQSSRLVRLAEVLQATGVLCACIGLPLLVQLVRGVRVEEPAITFTARSAPSPMPIGAADAGPDRVIETDQRWLAFRFGTAALLCWPNRFLDSAAIRKVGIFPNSESPPAHGATAPIGLTIRLVADASNDARVEWEFESEPLAGRGAGELTEALMNRVPRIVAEQVIRQSTAPDHSNNFLPATARALKFKMKMACNEWWRTLIYVGGGMAFGVSVLWLYRSRTPEDRIGL